MGLVTIQDQLVSCHVICYQFVFCIYFFIECTYIVITKSKCGIISIKTKSSTSATVAVVEAFLLVMRMILLGMMVIGNLWKIISVENIQEWS